jgi:hypothetical protein
MYTILPIGSISSGVDNSDLCEIFDVTHFLCSSIAMGQGILFATHFRCSDPWTGDGSISCCGTQHIVSGMLLSGTTITDRVDRIDRCSQISHGAKYQTKTVARMLFYAVLQIDPVPQKRHARVAQCDGTDMAGSRCSQKVTNRFRHTTWSEHLSSPTLVLSPSKLHVAFASGLTPRALITTYRYEKLLGSSGFPAHCAGKPTRL